MRATMGSRGLNQRDARGAAAPPLSQEPVDTWTETTVDAERIARFAMRVLHDRDLKLEPIGEPAPVSNRRH